MSRMGIGGTYPMLYAFFKEAGGFVDLVGEKPRCGLTLKPVDASFRLTR